MSRYYVLLAESVFTDENNPLQAITVEGDPITVNRNYAVTKEVPILDEDGNPTGESRTVFDYWDIQEEQHPDLWGGQIVFGFLEHPGLGPYYYCVLSGEDATLQALESLKPNDIRWVANFLTFDQPIPNQWRGKLNVFLGGGNKIPNGTLQSDAAKIVADYRCCLVPNPDYDPEDPGSPEFIYDGSYPPMTIAGGNFAIQNWNMRDVESENLINIQPVPSQEADTGNGKKPKKVKTKRKKKAKK